MSGARPQPERDAAALEARLSEVETENAALRGRCSELEANLAQRLALEGWQLRRTQQHAFRAEVSRILGHPGALAEVLQRCAQAVVVYFDAAFARIWLLNEPDGVLELRASAGLYTHLDGGHSRVRLGELQIGAIAAEGRPHLTNDVSNDPGLSDQEWAEREGLASFAGYPLISLGRVVGVIALFA